MLKSWALLQSGRPQDFTRGGAFPCTSFFKCPLRTCSFNLTLDSCFSLGMVYCYWILKTETILNKHGKKHLVDHLHVNININLNDINIIY